MSLNAMTADTIRARIAEIVRKEAAHGTRDLDAELSKVILAGGDVDAAEAEIAEAERAARRLRAERLALEKALPDAVSRDGVAVLVGIKRRHDEAATEIDTAINDLSRSWGDFMSAFSAFQRLQDEAFDLTRRAGLLAHETKAPAVTLGNFKSARVEAICLDLQRIPVLNVLASVGVSADAIDGVQSKTID